MTPGSGTPATGTPVRGLKLRAQDEADLQVIAACVQDALVPVADMVWLRDERRFALVINRFMWEVPPEPAADGQQAEDDPQGDPQSDPRGDPQGDLLEDLAPEPGSDGEVYSRTHGILSFQKVAAVRVRGIDQKRRDRVLCLLSVLPGEGTIDLTFAEGGTVQLKVDAIDCYLKDVGSPWPTRWRPEHADPQHEDPA
jgi:hypothetical protein